MANPKASVQESDIIKWWLLCQPAPLNSCDEQNTTPTHQPTLATQHEWELNLREFWTGRSGCYVLLYLTQTYSDWHIHSAFHPLHNFFWIPNTCWAPSGCWGLRRNQTDPDPAHRVNVQWGRVQIHRWIYTLGCKCYEGKQGRWRGSGELYWVQWLRKALWEDTVWTETQLK